MAELGRKCQCAARSARGRGRAGCRCMAI